MISDIAIRVKNITKAYQIYDKPQTCVYILSIRGLMMLSFKRRILRCL